MNNNNRIITEKRQMEEMLPDYAFGRLSEHERGVFERSLHQFPEIEQELAEVEKVFAKVQSSEYEDYYNRRTRNLSVNVLRRIDNSKNIRKTIARLVPALGLVAAFIVFISMQRPSSIENVNVPMTVTMPGDADYVAESAPDDELADAISDFAASLAPEAETAPSVSGVSVNEMLASVSTPFNESLIEDQILSGFTQFDINNIIESSNNETSL